MIRCIKAKRWNLALPVLALACLTGAQTAQGGGAPVCDFNQLPEVTGPLLEAPFAFETIELSDGSGRRFEVRLPVCGEVLCPIEVRLRDNDTVYDSVQFSECAAIQRPRRSEDDSALGIGDLLPRNLFKAIYPNYLQIFLNYI